MTTPRRPAQLRPEQIELIEGESDTATNSELAHTSAQAVVPLGQRHSQDEEVIERVRKLIETDGVDVLAESWVDSPDDSLPGILWRGYLLREWIRRYPEEAQSRYAAAREAFRDSEPEKLEQVEEPTKVREMWDEVLKGNFRGDFEEVMRVSARFTDFIGRLQPVWIANESHPLATEVTLRDTAMLQTAGEFRNVGERLARGILE